jgi:2,3-bisphosphoglycerate-dependent phosphoglycerate mutase
LRLYLIRHSHTLPTGPDASAWPLSSEGESEAEALADAPFWREIKALYSSPEHKALATVRPAAVEHGLEIREDDRLREAIRPVHWIEDYAAAVRCYLEHLEETPDGWEPISTVRKRMSECLDEIEERHTGENVAVCSHGLAFTIYLSGISRAEPFELWRSTGFTTVAVIEDRRIMSPFRDLSEAET